MRPFLILGLCFAFVSCMVVTKASMPSVGAPAQSRVMVCPSGQVEVHLYDYAPPSDDVWRAMGFAVRGERDFVVIYHETPGGEGKVYLDLNRDGRVDKVLTRKETGEKYTTVCDLYEREIARKRAAL